jgi:hypothetical protein
MVSKGGSKYAANDNYSEGKDETLALISANSRPDLQVGTFRRSIARHYHLETLSVNAYVDNHR